MTLVPDAGAPEARYAANEELHRLRAAILAHGVKFAASFDKEGRLLDWGLDLREVLYRPAQLRTIARLLWRRIAAWQPDFIGGMTLSAEQLTAGLLQAALDDGRELGGFSVRRTPKPYGMRRQVEGVAPTPGARVVVVDDLIDSGRTIAQVTRLVTQCGARAVGCAAVVDFGNRVLEAHPGAEMARAALFDLDALGLRQRTAVPRQAPYWRADGVNRGTYTAPQSTPLVDPQGVVAAGDTGVVRAWDHDGNERWRFAIGKHAHGVRTVIEGLGDTLLVAGYDGCVVRLRRDAGIPLWSTRVGAFVGASLAIDSQADRIYLAANHASRGCDFAALDGASGEVLWRSPAPSWSYARPALVVGGVVCAANDGHLRRLDRGNGKIRWRVDAGAPVKGWIATDGEACFFGAFDGVLWAIDAADGRTIWRRKLADWLVVHPALAGSAVLVGGKNHLGAFDRRNGSLLWVRESGRVTGLALDAQGRHAIGGNDAGDCFCIDVHSGVYRWQWRAPASFRATPGCAGGRGVIPCYDGSLYGFHMPD